MTKEIRYFSWAFEDFFNRMDRAWSPRIEGAVIYEVTVNLPMDFAIFGVNRMDRLLLEVNL